MHNRSREKCVIEKKENTYPQSIEEGLDPYGIPWICRYSFLSSYKGQQCSIIGGKASLVVSLICVQC